MLTEAWNALQDCLAVIDDTGRILIVNRAWEEFGARNGLKEGLGGVGADYLAICDAVRGEDEATARAAAIGIRQVLAGRLPVFELNYACHSPDEERWFLLRATRYVEDGKAHAILMHEIVTDRHQSQWEQEMAAEYLQLINGCSGVRNLVETTVRFFRRRSGCEAVGIRLREGDDYPYYEARGFPEEFIRAENSLCVRSADGKVERDARGNPVLACMCGNVIAGRFDATKPFFTPMGSFWTNSTTELLANTSEQDRMSRTRNRCHGEGYESVALIPMRLGREVMGLLQLNDKQKNRFTAAKVAMWERLAGYLTIALSRAQAEEELAASQTTLSAAVESTTDVMFIKDTEGRYSMVNGAMCRLLRKPQSELLGRSDAELFPPEVAAELQKRDREILAGKVPSFVEQQFPTPGGLRTFLGVKTVLWTGEGKIKGIFGISRDITERKVSEEALKESEEKFSKAFQACAESLVIVSMENGAIIEANEAFLRKMGLSREATIGHTSVELGFWTEAERTRFVQGLQTEGYLRNFEVKLRIPNGEIRDFIMSSEYVELAEKRCSLSFILDVTERKRAEELLKLRESYLTSIIENQPGLIWLKDKNGRFLTVNKAFARSCGMEFPEELVGKTDLDIWPRELAERYRADDAGVMEKGKPLSVEEPVFDRGEIKWFETFKTPVYDDTGKVIGTTGYARDITERKAAEEALRRSERMLRESQQVAGLGSYEMDIAAGLWRNSEVLDEIFGIGAEYFRSVEGWVTLVHPVDREAMAAYFQDEVLGAGKDFDREYRIVRPSDGAERWVHGLGKLERDGDGRIVRMWGTIQDITERKLADNALRESDERWQFALEGAGDGVWDWNVPTGKVFYSRQWKAILGYSDEEVGDTLDEWARRVHPEDMAGANAAIDAHFAGRTPVYVSEHRIRDKDGNYIWILDRGKAISWTGEGKPLRVIGTHCDITARKRAEEALKASETRLAAALEAGRMGMWELDVATSQSIWNAREYEVLGLPVGDGRASQKMFFERVHPEDRERVKAALLESVREGRQYRNEFRIIRGDGQERWVESMSLPMMDRGGKTVKMVGVIFDVTERKTAEEALKKSEEKFLKAFRVSPEPLMIVSLEDGKFLDVNEAFLRKWKLRREEAVGRTSVEMGLWTEAERAPFTEKLMREGTVRGFDVRFRLPNGEWGDFIMSSEMIELEGKRCSLGFILDITERKRAEEGLRASESRLAAALDGARLGLWEWDVGANRSVWNATEYELLGLPVGDGNVSTSEFLSRVHPEDVAGLQAELEAAFRSAKEYRAEYRVIRADGAERWMAGAGRVIRDGEGKSVKMIGINQDITERRRAEEALRESERQYRSLFDGMTEGFAVHEIITDEAGRVVDYRFLDVNPAFERLTGLKGEVVVGRTYREVLPEEDEKLIEMYGEVALEGKAAQYEHYSPALKRHYSVLAYRPAAGQFATIFMDVTARKAAEAEIQLLKQSIDLHSDGAYWFDTENRIVYVNEAACRAVGYTREELLGQHLSMVNPAAVEVRLAWVWEKLRETGRYVGEAVHRRKDGTDLPVEISCTLVRFGGKEYNCGFARDISERKKAETEIGRHQAAVAHLSRLNVMGQMATGLAHELNQPLTAIRNYAHYCRTVVENQGELEKELPEALGRIDQAVARASQIIQRMREFVRKDPPVRKETDVNKLIRKCLDLMKPALNQQRVSVERGLAKQLPTVVADEVQIEQVVVNLIQNAVDAMAETPVESKTVRVETTVTGEGLVMVAIKDQGCGIAAENAERIFDEFFTTNKKTGTGLGLSISKQIVESHGGRLTARGNPGGGTIFELLLPLKKGS